MAKGNFGTLTNQVRSGYLRTNQGQDLHLNQCFVTTFSSPTNHVSVSKGLLKAHGIWPSNVTKQQQHATIWRFLFHQERNKTKINIKKAMEHALVRAKTKKRKNSRYMINVTTTADIFGVIFSVKLFLLMPNWRFLYVSAL